MQWIILDFLGLGKLILNPIPAFKLVSTTPLFKGIGEHKPKPLRHHLLALTGFNRNCDGG
jgi:hypothetical protein